MKVSVSEFANRPAALMRFVSRPSVGRAEAEIPARRGGPIGDHRQRFGEKVERPRL